MNYRIMGEYREEEECYWCSFQPLHCTMQTTQYEAGRQLSQGACRVTVFPLTSAQEVTGEERGFIIYEDAPQKRNNIKSVKSW